MSIPSEDVLLNALNHKIRRDVLVILEKGEASYSQLLDHFAVSTGKLNYHLKLLQGFVEKGEDGRYRNTPLGQKALNILKLFRTEISDEERPLIRDAYLSQRKRKQSFLHLMYSSRMTFKFGLLVAIMAVLLVLTAYYIAEGMSPLIYVPSLAIAVVGTAFGVYWIRKVRKAAPAFIERMDKLLEKDD